MEYIRNLPESEIYDVVVLGGGPAGIGAAVSAARKGCRVCLIERFGFLGGMATAGFVNPMSEFAYNGKRVVGGVAWEFAQKMISLGGAVLEKPRLNVSFHPEVYKLAAQEFLIENNVHVMMNTAFCDCIMTGEHIDAAVVTNKGGLQAVRGTYFIDATGDADLAFAAGVPMLLKTRPMQPGTLCFTLSGVDTATERMHIVHQKNHRFNHQAVFIRDTLFSLREQGVEVPLFGGPWLSVTTDPGCITVNMTRSSMNACDPEDYQRAEAAMRRDVFRLVELLKAHVPEFAGCHLSSVASMAGIRESRRIKGLHVLTGEEYIHAVHFSDAITRSCHAVDIHLPKDEGQVLSFPEDAGYIPYRSLVDETHDNLLVAGRAISADEEAFAATRVQAPCMETGQAAGIAASLCLGYGNLAVQKVDTEKLVRLCKEAGSLCEEEIE